MWYLNKEKSIRTKLNCSNVLVSKQENSTIRSWEITAEDVHFSSADAKCTSVEGLTFWWCSMRISTTMFWNFRSMMAATVSSCGLINVGPNTTPKLATVIRLFLLWAATLERIQRLHFTQLIFSPLLKKSHCFQIPLLSSSWETW